MTAAAVPLSLGEAMVLEVLRMAAGSKSDALARRLSDLSGCDEDELRELLEWRPEGHRQDPVIPDLGARWRWSGDRLTEKVAARLSQDEHTRLWRFASRNGTGPAQVIRQAVREFLAVHDDGDEHG